ncbi:hypothetical protein FOG18_00365 [Legionella israelensis]|uniref:hypothetical protein n=1 Tax=Legionella israelensis TaxID=454 RepID=UPI00117C0F91|nr:hypothetical protein [Legionella israelensis]QDP71145.1 hypothetical protein FOG18_00365 [Legionella israelensis]
MAKWEINAGEAFKNIPEEYRDYIVVRSRKDIRGNRIDDAVIPHYASIHKELTSERRDKKAKIDALVSVTRTAGDPCSKEKIGEALTSLSEARESLKSDRKMETARPLDNGHNQNWGNLKNRSGKTARTFFKEFVQRAEKDHSVKQNSVVVFN